MHKKLIVQLRSWAGNRGLYTLYSFIYCLMSVYYLNKLVKIKLPTSVGSQKKQESLRKTSASLTMLKLLTVWITTNCGKFFKSWKCQTNLLSSKKHVCRTRSNSQNWTWKDRWVPNWEKSMSRLYIVTCLFNIYAEYIMKKCQAG